MAKRYTDAHETETLLCILEAVESLSPRQRQVLELIAAGYTQEETAAKMGLARTTVLEYLRRGRHEITKLVGQV